MNNTTNNWEDDFQKQIGHDDWCKTLKYPKSSWDCNCYMKDSLAFIRQLLHDTEQSAREGKLYDDRELDVFIAQAKAEAIASCIAAVQKIGATNNVEIAMLKKIFAALSKE